MTSVNMHLKSLNSMTLDVMEMCMLLVVASRV